MIRIWFVAFLFAAMTYSILADKGPQWQDSGWHQVRIVSGEIDHPGGIALTHPVHFYLGRLFLKVLPIEPAFAITLVSVLAAAITIANLIVLLLSLGIDRSSACIAVAGLLVAHTFVEHATHTESYALVAALLTTEWLLLAKYQRTRSNATLAWLFFVNGIAVANHMLAALATPIYAIVALLTFRSKTNPVRVGKAALRTLSFVAAFVVGLMPLLVVMGRSYAETGNFAETIKSALVGGYGNDVLNTSLSLRSIALAAGYCIYNFPNLVIPFAVVGIIVRRRNPNRLLLNALLAQFVIYALFVLRYSIVDQYSYFFVIYIFVAIWAAIGLHHTLKSNPSKKRSIAVITMISITLTPAIYLTTATILGSRGSFKSMVGNKPYRNGYQAFFIPWGYGSDFTEMLNQVVINEANENGIVLFEERMTYFGVRYAQLTGRLGDSVNLVIIGNEKLADSLNDEIRIALNSGNPVLLVPRDRDHPREIAGFTHERIGDIYKIKRE